MGWPDRVLALGPCPYPVRLHPQVAEIQQRVQEWAEEEVALIPSPALAQAAGFGRLAASLYPSGDAQTIAVAGCVLLYLFELDESLVEAPGRANDPVAAARQLLRWEMTLTDDDTDAPPDLACQALNRLWTQLTLLTGAEERARLREAWRTYGMAAACEATMLAARMFPSPQEYDLLRRHTITDWSLILIGVTRGYSLPGALWCAPSVRALNRLAKSFQGCCNDIASCPKEIAASATSLNYLTVYARHHNCSLERGLEMTRVQLNQTRQDFIRLREQLQMDAGPALARYLDDIADLVAGWHHWCTSTSRYINSSEG